MLAAPSPAVQIRDLRVDYGEFIAVDDLTLDVPRGEVFGIVGPNGAGKTSTFKVVATLMEPTYGEVKVAGYDVLEQTESARRVMGYMPDLAPVPSDLRVNEFLHFHAHMHSLGNRSQRLDRVQECLEMVNLTEKRTAWCKKLSRGQTQRLVLAKTLLHRPEVFILDEPASGLDPLSRRELRLILQKLASTGATVLVSSHILSELAEMCSSICILNQGRLLASGSAEEVRQKMGRIEKNLMLVTLGQNDRALSLLQEMPTVTEAALRNGAIEFGFQGTDDDQADLLSALVGQGVAVKSYQEKESSFEDILVDVALKNNE